MFAVRYLTSAGKPNLCNKLVSGCGIRQRAHTTSAAKFAVARRRTFVPIALFMVALCSAAAQAQEKRGTAEQRAACTPDALRLCLTSIPDATKVEKCLRQRKSDLTSRCRSLFELPTSFLTTKQIGAFEPIPRRGDPLSANVEPRKLHAPSQIG
jgi:hypothetical protein